ncbi:hypothetical protein LOY37_26910 [Pseudomonas sp. B21-012]|uniref:hypothetical protein n=1 Tax=unclassified Pseudomonas TaxID=196821 RepID=UPI0021607CCA|nr:MULTISPECIES: hypothetical protein [unclassified Pseudomonas]UVL61599.1 hypothetical protein LOY54_26975 [Pseudomonas sp. B21-032]UVM55912.1 hypothetical protein LOY37_26910 [Pseudomonas sp. B21-012]
MKRRHYFALAMVGALVLWVGHNIQVLIDRPGEVRVVSESGRYLMENVPVGGWLVPFDDLAYLRFIDRSNQKQVYRTPLFSQTSLDMRDYEDDGTVGIVWISLYKADGHIEIAIPNWKPHWLNYFISNTPYDVADEQADCRKPENALRFIRDVLGYWLGFSDYWCTPTQQLIDRGKP